MPVLFEDGRIRGARNKDLGLKCCANRLTLSSLRLTSLSSPTAERGGLKIFNKNKIMSLRAQQSHRVDTNKEIASSFLLAMT